MKNLTDLGATLHPRVAAIKEEQRVSWRTQEKFREVATKSIAGLRENDPWFFFKGFMVGATGDGSGVLSIYGYICFQQLLLAIEFGGFTPEELGVTQSEAEDWISRSANML